MMHVVEPAGIVESVTGKNGFRKKGGGMVVGRGGACDRDRSSIIAKLGLPVV